MHARWPLIPICAAICAVAFSPVLPSASAATPRRIEVVDISGIVDGPAARAIVTTISRGEQERARLVVVQLDSRGVIELERTVALQQTIRAARVPIAVWVPPSGHAANGAAVLTLAAHVPAMAPSATLGPIRTLDLRRRAPVRSAQARGRGAQSSVDALVARGLDARAAMRAELVKIVAPSLEELLIETDGLRVEVSGRRRTLRTDPDSVEIRFRKIDLFGRVLHAAAQPSIVYLLLLLGLVGIVFEAFHPSTGPAGFAGLLALALSLYGVVTLGGSWIGVALVVVGVAGFAIDLRNSRLGLPTILGFLALVAGSVWLFHGPWLRVSPWVLGFGIAGMVAFLLGAMTRVLRDLRALARGEIQVQDSHPHPNGEGGDRGS